MRDFENALKAVGDPTRTRILKLLEEGDLCVCQIQAVLGHATSTVSKHLSILKGAGLVEDRRAGKWIHYALAPDSRNPHARGVLGLVQGVLDRDPRIVEDRKRLKAVLQVPLVNLCSFVEAGKGAGSGRASARRRRPERRPHA
jgi:ArsR family transcriptional regulator